MIVRICPYVRSVLPGLVPSTTSATQSAFVHHHLERKDLARFLGINRSNKARANRNTHVNEKIFRKLRGKKTVVLDLPDDEERRHQETLTPSQLRIELLRKGINPYKEVQPRTWQESQITMQSFYGVIDPFVTPEETLPIFSGGVDGVKEKGEELKQRMLHRYHNWRNGTNRIRKKEGFEKFDAKRFGPTADLIYEEAHRALMKRDKPALHKCITEHAFAVVSVRCADHPYKSGNDIAQITVRMHTKQKLAIYDRFGHLLLGSETELREVVEYVVFENHIAVIDGTWRLHDKVYPKWVTPKQGAHTTFALGEANEESRPSHSSSLPLRVQELEEQRKKDKKKNAEDSDA
uniref:Large ribosomal subunit protein mL45 n=1 Tax=Angiostrongylus cantonensis TaxID=6313 RepID=A0A0K0DN14_ANGCA